MKKRFSAAQALQHPFILESNVDVLFPADTELLAKMTQVKPLTPFQQINMKILCELLSLVAFDFVQKAMCTFVAINKSRSGEVSEEEFVNALEVHKVEMDAEKARTHFRAIDWDRSGTISWSEFLCSLARICQLTQSNLEKVYKFLNLEQLQCRRKDLERAYKPHLFRLK